MEIGWLLDFLTLSDGRNFSRAAERRNLTQPAFSRRIRSLEEWLGVSLFDRSTHPASLTEAGQRFKPLAEDILRRVAEAREETRAAGRAAASTLRFSATHVLSLTFFPDWLRGLEARVQVGPVQLISDSLQACEDAMLQGRVQFLLCHHHDDIASRLDHAAFASVQVGEDILLPVTGADEAGQPRFSLEHGPDGPAPLLFYSPESGLGRIVRNQARQWSEELGGEPVFTSHLAVVLKTMALEGRGVAWLPGSLIRDELGTGHLHEVGSAEMRIPLQIRLFRRRAPESAAVEAFWRVVDASEACS